MSLRIHVRALLLLVHELGNIKKGICACLVSLQTGHHSQSLREQLVFAVPGTYLRFAHKVGQLTLRHALLVDLCLWLVGKGTPFERLGLVFFEERLGDFGGSFVILFPINHFIEVKMQQLLPLLE